MDELDNLFELSANQSGRFGLADRTRTKMEGAAAFSFPLALICPSLFLHSACLSLPTFSSWVAVPDPGESTPLAPPPARPPAFDSTQRPPTDEPTGHPFPWLPTTGTVSLLRLSHHPPATHRQSYQRRVPVANFRHFGQNGTHGPDRRRCAVTALSSASLCFSRLRCFLVFIFFSLLLPSTALVPLGG